MQDDGTTWWEDFRRGYRFGRYLWHYRLAGLVSWWLRWPLRIGLYILVSMFVVLVLYGIWISGTELVWVGR